MEAAAAATNELCTRGARNRAHIPAFGNWDLEQHHVPITQYFECCARPHPATATRASAYPDPYAPYPPSYARSGYVDHEFLNSMFADRDDFHGLYYAGLQQQHPDSLSKHYPHARPPPSPNMTGGNEVKVQCGTRRQRRRRSYLVDNKTKVFDVSETIAAKSCYDAVVTPDLYDVASTGKMYNGETQKKKSNVKGKDEDLYKIPPELLRETKRKKMSKFFTKCFVTICASL